MSVTAVSTSRTIPDIERPELDCLSITDVGTANEWSA